MRTLCPLPKKIELTGEEGERAGTIPEASNIQAWGRGGDSSQRLRRNGCGVKGNQKGDQRSQEMSVLLKGDYDQLC